MVGHSETGPEAPQRPTAGPALMPLNAVRLGQASQLLDRPDLLHGAGPSGQFSIGTFSAWSTTRTSDCPFFFSSLSPSWSRTASMRLIPNSGSGPFEDTGPAARPPARASGAAHPSRIGRSRLQPVRRQSARLIERNTRQAPGRAYRYGRLTLAWSGRR